MCVACSVPHYEVDEVVYSVLDEFSMVVLLLSCLFTCLDMSWVCCYVKARHMCVMRSDGVELRSRILRKRTYVFVNLLLFYDDASTRRPHNCCTWHAGVFACS